MTTERKTGFRARSRKATQFTFRFVRRWPAHLWTVGLVILIAAIWPKQAPILVYKAALLMVGGCVGYWLDRFFFSRSDPCRGGDHRRWQLVALMCAAVLAMSMGA